MFMPFQWKATRNSAKLAKLLMSVGNKTWKLRHSIGYTAAAYCISVKPTENVAVNTTSLRALAYKDWPVRVSHAHTASRATRECQDSLLYRQPSMATNGLPWLGEWASRCRPMLLQAQHLHPQWRHAIIAHTQGARLWRIGELASNLK